MALTEVNTQGIKNASIKLEDIENGTSSDNGKFLKNNDGAAPSWSTVSTDLVGDTSPQLGGDLATNGNEILVADNDELRFGSQIDLTIKSDGTDSSIQSGSGSNAGELKIGCGTTANALEVKQASITTNTDQFLAYSDVVVGSPTTGQQHYIGLAEDAANGTHQIRFIAPAAITTTQSYTLWTTAATEGQYLKMGANAAMEWGEAGAGATGGGTEKIFWENGTTIDQDYTVGTSFGAACNAMSAGPITINSGKTVTVDAGDTWTII